MEGNVGKRGPKPTPTALKLVNGTRRSRIQPKRPISGTYERSPQPPKWLSEVAKGYWRRLGPELAHSGRLNPDNLESFAILCEAYARHERAIRVLDDPETDWFPGGTRRHPAMLEAKEASAVALRYGQEFGLTPASAASVKVPPVSDHAEADRLMS
jgi:P27 family predicted phage terminase small subunit